MVTNFSTCSSWLKVASQLTLRKIGSLGYPGEPMRSRAPGRTEGEERTPRERDGAARWRCRPRRRRLRKLEEAGQGFSSGHEKISPAHTWPGETYVALLTSRTFK